ncbi:hypothetical protein [Streptomyces olivaceus]|uniref:hypothetical protein n=1 Tax=Streptomyces olivaceus TaxID=47716 RepID=UPI001CCE02AB|nr:hypothetical protein [Streptomyces olivaceus]
MLDIELDGMQESLVGITVVELHANVRVPFETRGQESVHSIDDPERTPVHQQGREAFENIGQCPDVVLVKALCSGGVGRQKGTRGDEFGIARVRFLRLRRNRLGKLQSAGGAFFVWGRGVRI